MQQDTFVKERTALAAQPEQDEDTIDLLELALGLLAHWTLIAATAVVGAVLMALYTFFWYADVQGNGYHLCGQPQ